MKRINHIFLLFILAHSLCLMISCSSTSALPEGEQLFTGLKKIQYKNYEENPHAEEVKTEMEYVLASTPNSALFGSSYYRSPFPIRLWVWNAFSQSDDAFSKWITKAFGSKPKLMSQVNPTLRATVAESQLKKFGYFKGKVDSKIITQRNPKKAKVSYTVDLGHLWTVDTLDYQRYPAEIDTLITKTKENAKVKKGDPFSVSEMENERQRLTYLFRNNGYFYYNNGYSSYLADTTKTPGKVQLHLALADSLGHKVMHPWYIGNLTINFRKQFREELENTISRRRYVFNFNGRQLPIRAGAIMRDIKLRPGQLYSVDDEQNTLSNIQNTGLFSYCNLQFTPKDSSRCDSLDVNLDLVFDKPYDFYVEANAKGKTTGRVGPELVVGLTKRNAFRGGEKIDINLHGSYEWQTGHKDEGSDSKFNSYEYGGDVALVFPRLLTPRNLLFSFSTQEARRRYFQKHRGGIRKSDAYYSTPTTTLKASVNVLNRAEYFKRHVVSGELTYDWWPTAQSHHSFSPLILSYEYMHGKTELFEKLLADNPYLQISMRDQFVPKMSYTYSYKSPATYHHPISWSTTVSESGNILSASYALFGEKWSEKDKTMFKNPYAQFLKIETDFVKQWNLSGSSSLLAHLNTGIIYSYGNSNQAPYYEQFYVGGANSIRAFNVRSIGPGKYKPTEGRFSYIDQTGDFKLLGNLEYRPRLFGDLFGAIFLDAGNVWSLHDDATTHRSGGKFEFDNFLKQMAVGTGIGVRYDLGMFVIRLDWGIGIHVPYETGKNGFYNIKSFRDGQSIHLAVGYPF